MHVRMRSERTYYRAIAGDAAQFAPGNVFFVALALYVMLIQLLVHTYIDLLRVSSLVHGIMECTSVSYRCVIRGGSRGWVGGLQTPF